MTLPTVYDLSKVDQLYEPNLQAAYTAGLADFRRPAEEDKRRILAWLIDMQGDFIFPAPLGRLSVPGAPEDSRRTIEWIYRNVHQITHISASLDTHTPLQIFFAGWWQNGHGQHPAPFTVISAEAVHSGLWLPVKAPEWSVHYVEELERVGKKQLMIWPFHCMEGTAGRALLPALSEAIMYHSGARRSEPLYLPKGTLPYTEYYSVVEPEVKYPDHPDGVLNTYFLKIIAAYDLIYVAGQARSHCVLETVNSIVTHFASQPDVIGKFRFLDDCTSSIPGFEAQTEARLREFAAQGVKFVRSTDPLG